MREEHDYERDWRWGRVILWVIAGIGFAMILGAVTDDARAHHSELGMKYDTWCCNGDGHSGDCQEIPSSAVKPIEGGWQVTLVPGDHRLVTRVHVFQIPQSNTRMSSDGRFHACLYPDENTLRCFYAPPMGS